MCPTLLVAIQSFTVAEPLFQTVSGVQAVSETRLPAFILDGLWGFALGTRLFAPPYDGDQRDSPILDRDGRETSVQDTFCLNSLAFNASDEEKESEKVKVLKLRIRKP